MCGCGCAVCVCVCVCVYVCVCECFVNNLYVGVNSQRTDRQTETRIQRQSWFNFDSGSGFVADTYSYPYRSLK